MKITHENITPAKARRMLEANTCNRKLRKRHAETLAQMMTNGHWLIAGDPIRFDVDGNLLDGQHRLTAVVISDTTQRFVVERGLAPEAYKAIDRGMKRSLADTLHTEGYQRTSLLGATIKVIWSYAYEGTLIDFRPPRYLTDDDVLDFLKAHPSIIDAVHLVDKHKKGLARIINTSMVAGWIFLYEHEPRFDETYWANFMLGTDLKSTSAAYQIRKFLEREALQQRKIRRGHMFYMGINAFERERLGGPVKHVGKIPKSPTQIKGRRRGTYKAAVDKPTRKK